MQLIKDAYAQGVDFSNTTINPVAKFSTISSFVNLMVPLMMIGGGLITLSMLLLGAYRYLTSEGNPEKITKAQNVMLYAVLGLFLIIASFVLTKIIGAVFNITMPI